MALRSTAPALVALTALSSPAWAAGPAPPVGPAAIALQAVADALGIPVNRARVVSTEARDFPDASLGCPQPGMAYAQVITPGHRVLVEADGRRFDVRIAGNHGRICYLRKPVPRLPAAGGHDASVSTPFAGAGRTACATRAG